MRYYNIFYISFTTFSIDRSIPAKIIFVIFSATFLDLTLWKSQHWYILSAWKTQLHFKVNFVTSQFVILTDIRVTYIHYINVSLNNLFALRYVSGESIFRWTFSDERLVQAKIIFVFFCVTFVMFNLPKLSASLRFFS